MSASNYRLYGLRISSEIELDAPRSASCDRPDIYIKRGAGYPVTDKPLPGELLAEHRFGDGYGYSVSLTGDGYMLRFRKTCEFTISKDLKTVLVHSNDDIDERLISLLICGNTIAVILALRGVHALHASAVEYDGSGLGFLGSRGMGKSTKAALLCANGGRLVTDDLLRLQYKEHRFLCFPGSPEIRLRKEVASIAKHFADQDKTKAVDGKNVLTCESTGDRKIPLETLVIPQPSRIRRRLHIVRLTGAEAMLALMNNTKITGWMDRNILQQRFKELSLVARNIPVFEAYIPWGPPFPAGFVSELTEALGLREYDRIT